MQVVIDFKIADLLSDKPDGASVAELASVTKIEEEKIARILRLLATGHVFTEGMSFCSTSYSFGAHILPIQFGQAYLPTIDLALS